MEDAFTHARVPFPEGVPHSGRKRIPCACGCSFSSLPSSCRWRRARRLPGRRSPAFRWLCAPMGSTSAPSTQSRARARSQRCGPSSSGLAYRSTASQADVPARRWGVSGVRSSEGGCSPAEPSAGTSPCWSSCSRVRGSLPVRSTGGSRGAPSEHSLASRSRATSSPTGSPGGSRSPPSWGEGRSRGPPRPSSAMSFAPGSRSARSRLATARPSRGLLGRTTSTRRRCSRPAARCACRDRAVRSPGGSRQATPRCARRSTSGPHGTE